MQSFRGWSRQYHKFQHYNKKNHQAIGLAIMFDYYRGPGLHVNGSLWTTEEALSLIKEEEVVISCEYVVPPNHTSQKCSSEQEGKQANGLTFNPHMTFKGCGDLSKVWNPPNRRPITCRSGFLFFELSIWGDFQWCSQEGGGTLINFPWTITSLPFGYKPGHPVQWFSKWDARKTH